MIDMSAGIPPFTINLTDNDTPPNTPSITINPPNMIGSITVSPNVISPTTYSIINITDGNGCSSTSPLTQDIIILKPAIKGIQLYVRKQDQMFHNKRSGNN